MEQRLQVALAFHFGHLVYLRLHEGVVRWAVFRVDHTELEKRAAS